MVLYASVGLAMRMAVPRTKDVIALTVFQINKNIAKGEKFFHILTDSIYQVDMTYDNGDS